MWVYPFMFGNHKYPLTTFYQEWDAGFLGFLALPLLMSRRYWQEGGIPRIALLPLGLLALVWLQYALGKIEYLAQALMFTYYLGWATLLVMLGHRLCEELGLSVAARWLAAFLLLGAELAAIAGIAQKYALHNFIFDRWVDQKASGPVFANLGQPNHLADYLVLGLAALGLLHVRLKMRGWLTPILAAPLLFVLVLTASRSTGFYFLLMLALAFLWQRRDEANRALLRYCLWILAGYVAMLVLVKLPWLAGQDNVTVTDRIGTAIGFAGSAVAPAAPVAESGWETSARLGVWHEAVLVFLHNPVLGAGFGQFGWQHAELAPLLRNPATADLFNHAHNIVLEIAALMGLAGLAVVFATSAMWLAQAKAAPRTAERWWGYSVLAVLMTHSMLEYPLYYAYFLGIAAVALGMTDTTVYRVKLRWAGVFLVFAVLLVGGVLFLGMRVGYEMLDRARLPIPVANFELEQSIRLGYLRSLHGMEALLMQPYIDKAMAEAGWDDAGDRGALNGKIMRYEPTPAIMYREAVLLAHFDRLDEARAQIDRAIWVYPGDAPANLQELGMLAKSGPDGARFKALLDHATQEYARYQAIAAGR